MQVEVAVIPAAGRGTRMRPATRVIPKALLPVVDRPAIQYAVEEAVRAGAGEAILIVDLDAGALIWRHFHEMGPLPGLDRVHIRLVVQEEPHGLGHAVWKAKEAVGDRPFFCLLADNIVPPGGDVLSGLAAASAGESVVCLRELAPEYLERYGVVVPGEQRGDGVIEVRGAVEKPGKEDAPSRLGLIGRYLFTPEVFPALEQVTAGYGGEIQLTDAIDHLGRGSRCLGAVCNTDLLDVGTPLGLLEATTVIGLAGPEWGSEFRKFLEDLDGGR